MEFSNLDHIRTSAFERIKQADSTGALNGVRITYLGRNGELTAFLKNIQHLPIEERPATGKAANMLKQELEEAIQTRQADLTGESIDHMTKTDWIDVSMPTSPHAFGHLHPLTQIRRQLVDIFSSMGFETVEGPQIDTDAYNFEYLNIPPEHPARDMWDTFWVKSTKKDDPKIALRPHTSNMQVRYMQENTPPFKVVVPGRCFRFEATDANHENTFNQIEGFVVDTNITVANLIATLESMLRAIFEKKVEIRLRPSYFPFVEPGFEVDMQCLVCSGSGCKTCSQTGWLEMLGCGMIHPEVLKHGNINPKKYSGFAFGMGMDRLAMMKFGIDEIRLLHSGDLRLTNQF